MSFQVHSWDASSWVSPTTGSMQDTGGAHREVTSGSVMMIVPIGRSGGQRLPSLGVYVSEVWLLMASGKLMLIHQATAVQARVTGGATAVAAAVGYLVHQVLSLSHNVSYRQPLSRRGGSPPHMQAGLTVRPHRTHKYRQERQASLPNPVNTPFLPGAPSIGPPAAGPSTWCTKYCPHALGRASTLGPSSTTKSMHSALCRCIAGPL